jgi:hypothetical protein
MRTFWTDNEINYLIENFENKRTDELALEMNRSVKGISKKATVLKLKKSKEHKSEMIGLRNKITGRDLCYENLKEIAQKYKARGEFQQLDNSAYTSARLMGVLDDICSHMISQSYSIPQLLLFEILKILIKDKIIYNSRKIISPYELDVYIPKYNLAFEYNGKAWHINDENDIIKKMKCVEEGIKLIIIKENNRKYVDDIKKQLVDNLDYINNFCSLKLTTENILDIDENYLYLKIKDSILDENDVKQIISKYKNFQEFRVNEVSLYASLLRKRALKHYTKNLIRKRILWDMNKAKCEISKYENYSDFLKNSPNCYLYIKRHKLEELLENLKRNNTVWDFYKIKELIIRNGYNTTYKIKKNHAGAFKYLKKNNLVLECREFMKKNQN